MTGIKNSSHHGSNGLPPLPPPPPPQQQQAPLPRLWKNADNNNSGISGTGGECQVHYMVRHPWQWVMEGAAKESAALPMVEETAASELPTSKQEQRRAASAAEADPSAEAAPVSTPATRRRRQQSKKANAASTLKIEIVRSAGTSSEPSTIDVAVHGSSNALDGLEDKDELVRTIQRCRCDQLHLSPPSVLINWDVTHEECINVVGNKLPTLRLPKSEKEANKNGAAAKDDDDDDDDGRFAVLKEPMGNQGKGIYFVQTAEEIHKVISEHRQRASAEPQFLDNLIEQKGRIPSWVLQAEVVPPLLIRGRRKFHIRTYLVLIEKAFDPDLLEMFIYNRHEVRVAGVPIDEGDGQNTRNSVAHITNGALSDTTDRALLSDIPELVERGIKDKLELFAAETFGKHLLPDIVRRVSTSAKEQQRERNLNPPATHIDKFALAGLDFMVTDENRIYLLEVNVNPACPPEKKVSVPFANHLAGFFRDMIDLVVGEVEPTNFLLTDDILSKHGRLD